MKRIKHTDINTLAKVIRYRVTYYHFIDGKRTRHIRTLDNKLDALVSVQDILNNVENLIDVKITVEKYE